VSVDAGDGEPEGSRRLIEEGKAAGLPDADAGQLRLRLEISATVLF
jgi:hypothetical protein